MKFIIQKIKAFWLKRKWNDEKKIYHLQLMLIQDKQWLSHNPIARELTQRYLSRLSEDWYTQCYESTDDLRDRLGLNPHREVISIEDKFREFITDMEILASPVMANYCGGSRLEIYKSTINAAKEELGKQ